MAFKIEKAKKEKHKLRLLVVGLSGTGKTFGALTIADGMGLLGHGRTVVLDTENKSSALYAKKFEFDIIEFDPPYSPERYVEAIEYAKSLGYELVIADSITHEHIFATEAVNRMEGKNGIKNWGDYKSKRRSKLIEKILKPEIHLICTGRVKSAYDEVEDTNGRKKLTKIGTQLKQEDGLEYEFDVVIDLDRNHYYTCSKTRAEDLETTDPKKLTKELGVTILKWLDNGEEETPAKTTAKKPKSKAVFSEYAELIKEKINEADADDITVIGERLEEKEVIEKLSPDEHETLKKLYQAKVDSIESSY